MSKKTSVVWKYVKDGKCQIKEDGKICGDTVSSTQSTHVWRHIERFHKDLHKQLKANEEIDDAAISTQPTMDSFVNATGGPLKDLALLFATSTAPMSMLQNDRFKVNFQIEFI